MSEKRKGRERKLLEQGWTKRFIADEPRLGEAVQMYRSLGFEVLLEPVTSEDLDEECSECFKTACERYKIIYTRPKL